MKRIAINGFGRIGRLFFRQAILDPEIEVAAINDLGNLENLAYLLKFDSVYGLFNKDIKTSGTSLLIDGKEIKFFQIKNPAELPWKDLNIDIVVEATGVFESFELARQHIASGAKRVVLTAPAKDADSGDAKTVLVGVNEPDFEAAIITSNGSCTTNAASPVIAVLAQNPGIEKAILNTVHSYTATQSLVDGAVKGSDWRRGRAAADNIVPSTTGAALAVTRAFPDLAGKFDGISMRVPTVVGSIADITFISKRPTTAEEINQILMDAAAMPQWQGVLAATSEPIVSSDIVGSPYAAIVDLTFTKVIDGNLVKVLSWYDNEWGYGSVLLKHVKKVKI
ncbi:MAG: type I glyceraldehyde-3-phosphate dehydrogenase [Patescibacteria group bacterium]|nr:type I glyceraldehyde-3-phosphate dehydrogenase [Patescibacteria group bacterium]MCL5261881.1 type I glyceraldehyde-3-phosphate dehydrogenase [Patescibacteria group bacterium]